MELKDLIGKTIVSAKRKKLVGYYDVGFLELQFSDNTQAVIVATYDCNWTGNSENEYPTRIFVNSKHNQELEDFEY
jgi:hypothetical protein